MYKQSRILVTGGAGFLGSQLIRRLAAEEPRHITVLDDLFTGNENSILRQDNITFVHGSVTDSTLVRTLLQDADYVFHFAARNMLLSIPYPESDFTVNAMGTLQLLLNLLPQRNHVKRFVYASTSSIYGNAKELPITEERFHVSTPYAASKFAGELLVAAYCESFGLPATAVRFSNVYGPGQVSSNPYCGVVSKFMQAVVDGVPMTVYDDGEQSRDFTYVDDAINAVLLAGLSKRTEGQVMNVGTGVETTVNQLAALIAEIANHVDYPVRHTTKRKVDTVRRRVMDTTRLRQLTGWEPQVSLREGLMNTWEWFVKENQSHNSAGK
ncbi:NAD-dependent epimerase/dehydratase family protein [Alicyclobacillus sp. SO9]|uniref:NAD-dependent epimerase/dehydratase family protein n=1 Tax=Alicyclobacillus sp. SO9 TaxID=2665646 RepID=UPI0018E7334A|nr:NAD-dependent epimerase/dehydratase family protein [Alicyclobacillus sp. SO9]QQE80315.1 NAD-dependent epimerase/dehydratase family protein [Alicyclobacillus sp. SO9]